MDTKRPIIVISGSRYYTNIGKIYNVLTELNPKILIHGDCSGADKLAAKVATKIPGCIVKAYPADWKKFGSRAGPLRNIKMIDENTNITMGVIFHENLAESKGTRHTISLLEKRNIHYVLYE
jgi:hypothetical protein